MSADLYLCLSVKGSAFFIIIDPPAIIMERCFAQCSEFSSCQREVGWTSVEEERITFDRRLVAPTQTFSLEIQFDNNAM